MRQAAVQAVVVAARLVATVAVLAHVVILPRARGMALQRGQAGMQEIAAAGRVHDHDLEERAQRLAEIVMSWKLV